MSALARSLALMLIAPPLVLIAWVYHSRGNSTELDLAAVIVAYLAGLLGVATSPWSSAMRGLVAILYSIVALVALPLLTLVAECSTGNCL